MIKKDIKKKSSWPVLDEARRLLAAGKPLPPATFAVIADRLRNALESPDTSRLQWAAEQLEAFYRDMNAASSPEVWAASRGEMESDISRGYALGKIAFAQLLAGRVADTRADARFLNHITDLRYLPYVKALRFGPSSVTALSERAGERLETASRKLRVLRGLGIVVARKEGNVTVCMLTPGGMAATIEKLGPVPTDTPVPTLTSPANPDVAAAIEQKHRGLPEHWRAVPSFGRKSPFKLGVAA